MLFEVFEYEKLLFGGRITLVIDDIKAEVMSKKFKDDIDRAVDKAKIIRDWWHGHGERSRSQFLLKLVGTVTAAFTFWLFNLAVPVHLRVTRYFLLKFLV